MFKKKKDNKAENTTEGSAVPKKKSVFKIVFLLFLVLLLAAGAGAGAVFYMMTKKAPIAKSPLQPDILTFIENKAPDVYGMYWDLDVEMILTENEMTRIAKIGEEFPSDKKIPDTEYKVWENNMKALEKAQADFDKNIQSLYVTYLVTPEEGINQLKDKKDTLKQNLETAVTASKTLTDKLREIEAKKPILQRVKDMLTSKGKP
jgi:flagellar basal body-associated protein FliL